MHYTNDKAPIRFDDGVEVSRPWLAADDSRAQRVLRTHRDEKAQCMCTPHGVPMHVVCRDGRYFLATNPGRASHHALSCPAYQPDEEVSGLRHYSDQALSRAAKRHKLQVRREAPEGPPFPHFTPSAALQFVWEYAGLNICTPKTVVHRTFFLVARSLVQISHSIRFNEEALRLYVPLASDTLDGSRYVIGQVSKVNHGKYANAMKLAGDREHTFWIDPDNWQTAGLTEFLGPYEEPRNQNTTWIVGRLWRSPQGNWRLYDLGALPVNSLLLPCRPEAADALQALVDAKRRFVVCQRFDATWDDSVPLAVLIDRKQPQPVSYPLSS
jgi:hypothetical protein